MQSHVTSSWIASLPKIELHVHLEGTIRPATLLALQQRHGLDMGFSSLEELQRLYRYRDFSHYIDTYTIVSGSLREPQDFYLAVIEYGQELIEQNVMYAEVHFNPEPHWRRRGINVDDMLDQMNRARADLHEQAGLELRWIADGVRDAASGALSVDRTVDWMIDWGLDSGVVALGLGGNEIGNPASLFSDAFARARNAGFHVVAHAGEVTGPDFVRETVEDLHVERIGHGIGAARDLLLLELLAARNISVELCPTSNLCTGAVASIAQFPLSAFWDAGVNFSISSDDPPMFNTTLSNEYEVLARSFNLDQKDMIAIVRSSVQQSFADDVTRARMEQRLDEFVATQDKI